MMIVKKSKKEPLNPSGIKKFYQVDSKSKNMGYSYMFKEKVNNNQKLLQIGVAKYLGVLGRCPKSH